VTAIKRILWIAYSAVGIGCATTLEPYIVPTSPAGYATIEDQPYRFGANKYVVVTTIERKRVDDKSRGVPETSSIAVNASEDKTGELIVVAAGPRKLEIEVCKFAPGFWDFFSYFGGWYCKSTVLRLEASPGSHYRVDGTLNKKEDYAEFWIENTESDEKVAGPIRILGVK